MIVTIDGEKREVGLREAWNYISEEEWKKAARDAELDFFRSTHRYCGSCGAAMAPATEISVKCPECGREDFPSLSPAILVLVRKGDKALLVHARNFSRPTFALVAGFVETGESLEECVSREEIRTKHKQYPLLRKPVMAISFAAHDRIHRRLRIRRHILCRWRTDRRRLVQP